jgi:hypothetical protein
VHIAVQSVVVDAEGVRLTFESPDSYPIAILPPFPWRPADVRINVEEAS